LTSPTEAVPELQAANSGSLHRGLFEELTDLTLDLEHVRQSSPIAGPTITPTAGLSRTEQPVAREPGIVNVFSIAVIEA
jgi:hypothetical protein